MKTVKRSFQVLLSFFGLIVILSLTANSQNLAVWDFEGNVNTPSFTETHIVAGPATFGSSIGSIAYYAGNGSTSAYAGNSWSIGDLDPDAYIEFTIEPEAGYQMNLDQFYFEYRRSSTGVLTVELRSSLDGYTTTLLSVGLSDVTTWFTTSYSLPVDFLGLTAPVTIRVYGYDAEASTGTLRFDNVSFSGTVAEAPLGTPISDWALGIGILLIATFVIIRFRRAG